MCKSEKEKFQEMSYVRSAGKLRFGGKVSLCERLGKIFDFGKRYNTVYIFAYIYY